MPLSNNVIIKLNEITTFVENKNRLKESEIEEIKIIFNQILRSGDLYDIDDIESWFENEGTWPKSSSVRITNLAHYIQDKFEQTSRLRMISDEGDGCSCGH